MIRDSARHQRPRTGQALVEYAVLVGAVVLGATVAVKFAYQAFVAQAQDIEKKEIVF